ncbi:MAG: VWA domain-containing protein, partial [Streptosporangiaceae bacterium]|nr:VWA domain-containing protein [Streptosporangiaceae bacterium]
MVLQRTAVGGTVSYPFAAIVGMPDLKLALLLNAVSPAIGGVLVRGEKGTAKSTVVRGLAALLPPVWVVEGCRFACDPADPDPACPDGPHPGAPGAPPGNGDSAAGVPAAGAPSGAAAVRRPVTLAELPVGATEDRLTGSLDIERVLSAGVTAFQPGLLAAAHRGLLYVDEVNLLHDHLVDLLLDAAALGVNYVEREGVSVRHAARFLLVGTMNPEEGELRPQLLDRFGLTVQVAASQDPAERAEVVRRRLAFEADPVAFAARFDAGTADLAARVAAARDRLPGVRLPDGVLRQICAVCGAFGVDGMRADLVTARTAIALAAWHGRPEVAEEDIRVAARLALPHRRRRDPFDAPGLDEAALEEALKESSSKRAVASPQGSASPHPDDDPDGAPPDGHGGPPGGPPPHGGPSPHDGPPEGPPPHGGLPGGPSPHGGPRPNGGAPQSDGSSPQPGDSAAQSGDRSLQSSDSATPAQPDHSNHISNSSTTHNPEGQPAAPSAPFRARLLTVPGVGAGAPGRRSLARGAHGRTVGARLPAGRVEALHLPATIRAAASRHPRDLPAAASPHPRDLPAAPAPVGASALVRITSSDLREAVREGREGNLVLFAVDASGSMAARQRMRAVKGAVLSLLLDAYQRRDKVGLITFRGSGAEVALPPTSSVEAGARRLADLATGGRTPLAAGLALAARVLAAERIRDPARRPLLVIVTDGRATSGSGADLARAVGGLADVASVVIDCEVGPVRLGLAG